MYKRILTKMKIKQIIKKNIIKRKKKKTNNKSIYMKLKNACVFFRHRNG